MAHSFAQQASFTCQVCGQPFAPDVWLIIDTAERPDLIARVRDNLIHSIVCPNGHTGEIDAPLLLYWPEQAHPLLFCPARGTTAEQAANIAAALLSQLAKMLGADWRDAWLPNLMVIPPGMLPAVLADTEPGTAVPNTLVTKRIRVNSPEEPQAVPSKGGGRLEVPPYHTWVDRAQAALENYLTTGNLAALDEARAIWYRILDQAEFTAASEQFQLMALNAAGGLFLHCYWAYGRSLDLDRTLALWENVMVRTPTDSPDHISIQTNLAIGLRARYSRTGRSEDLQQAISFWEDAITRIPTNSPDRALIQTNLGLGLSDRYAQTGQLEDLVRAIDLWADAAACLPPNSHDRAGIQNNLGYALQYLYMRTGRLEDLEQAIAASTAAVNQTPDISPDRAIYQTNLGIGLYHRYARTGRLEDLERAIAAWEDAVARTTANPVRRASYINNLGPGLRERYMRTGRWEDLERAISMWEEAIANTPDNSPSRAAIMTNLGNGLSDRYARTGQLTDLERAIAAFENAVARTSDDSPNWAMIQTNLGNGLSDRYARTGQLADLERAIAAYEDALAHDIPDSPNRAAHQINLSLKLRARYVRFGRPIDLKLAVALVREACLSLEGIANDVSLRAARMWAKLALACQSWEETLQAATQGHATLLSLDRASILAEERLSWRREVQGLAAAEAYACMRLGGDPQAAVLALESGQAGQLNAALGRGRDRELLVRLRGDDSALFTAYQAAAAEARAAQSAGGDIWRNTSSVQPDAATIRARATAAQKALDDVVARIAARPGYEALFSPLAFADVAAAVEDAPMAYLATTPAGSLILLLHKSRTGVAIKTLWADLTSDELDRLQVRRAVAEGNVGPVEGGLLWAQIRGTRLGQELADTLPKLGEGLMAPLAAQLREMNATAITLIPGGELNLLPLHAATYKVDDAPRAFLDEFTVTFVPSAQTAAKSRARVQRGRGAGELEDVKALVVGNPLPLPEGVASLSYAREEAEEVTALLDAQVAFTGRVMALYETAATLGTVTDALPDQRVLHFACHGIFDTDEPLNSGLVMVGGEMLTLRAVRDSTTRVKARLVILSACQTGITDFHELPDEVIGLPAGFLAAGAAGVIGSLWPVDDRSTALLMTDFHRRVLAGASPAEALRAAQLWLRRVTWGELDAYYTKFLPRKSAEDAQVEATQYDPTEAAYPAPYHWAAFTFSGA